MLAVLIILSLLAMTESHVTVREVELPSEYHVLKQGLEFYRAYGSLVRKTVDAPPSGPLLKRDCVDTRPDSVLIAGVHFVLDVIHVNAGEIDDRAHNRYVVRRGNEIVFDATEALYASDVWAFYSHENSWILETPEQVVVDGVSLNDVEKCDETFHYMILDDTPIFLMRKDDKISVKFGSVILDHTYDEVLHHLCCEPTMYNPGCTDSKIMFFAYRNDQFLYVEIEANPHN
jgi:hypothetical protein